MMTFLAKGASPLHYNYLMIPVLSLLLSSFAFSETDSQLPASLEEAPQIHKQHITYLMRRGECQAAVDLYKDYYKTLKQHDFEVLQELALILLEQGAHSEEPEKQIISLYGSAIAGISSSIDILEAGIKSHHPESQIAAIQFLGQIQDDRCDELLIKAMSSEYLGVRIEAAYQLAVRKHPVITGQIEALMYRIPHEFRAFFPSFFALIGTSDAIRVLRHLMDDSLDSVRIEAILSAARYERDDLLPIIRASLTHLNSAEQEACATALGFLKDSKSIPSLKKLSSKSSTTLKLALSRALYQLGDLSQAEHILEMAQAKDLFAIAMLADIPESEDVLARLVRDPHLQVRLNAVISLLKLRDPRCQAPLFEFLIKDTKDIGFQPQFSMGRSMMAWKAIPSLAQHAKESYYDLQAVSLSLRETLLRDALELPQQDFLVIAERIFDIGQTELVPLLVSLLENLQTPDAIKLLEKKAQKAGAPLIRSYCNLALFRLKLEGPYEERLYEWISQKKRADMIRFRPVVPWGMRLDNSPFELTPEESSNLLIQSYEALADRHDEKGIDLLLDAIRDGHPTNRYVLAGLLIRTIQ